MAEGWDLKSFQYRFEPDGAHQHIGAKMTKLEIADKLRVLHADMRKAAENVRFMDAMAIKVEIGDIVIGNIGKIIFALERE